ncbi:MAG: FliH/SctL family protein [Opitutales bacterium]
MRLASPIKKVELAYFGEDRIDPAELEGIRSEATAEGRSQAEEVHNAQILEFREELRSLHDDVLGSLMQEFETLKQGVAEAMPRMAIALLKKTLPTVTIDAEAIEKQIEALVKEYSGEDEGTLNAYVAPDDFRLMCKSAGASPDAEFLKEGNVCVTPKENLTHGDCQLLSKFGLIDASIQTKVKHLEIALLGQ